MHLLVQIVKVLSHEILIVITLVWARECFRLRDTCRHAGIQAGRLLGSQKFSKECLQDDGQACRLAASRLAGKETCRKTCMRAGWQAGL